MSDFDFKVGDIIEFRRVYQPYRESKVVREPGHARPVTQPAIHEQILDQPGSGTIALIHKSPRKVEIGRDRDNQPLYETVHTAKVPAGHGLGDVSAVLDDAVLKGVQDGLFSMQIEEHVGGMYGRGANGGAS